MTPVSRSLGAWVNLDVRWWLARHGRPINGTQREPNVLSLRAVISFSFKHQDNQGKWFTAPTVQAAMATWITQLGFGGFRGV